MKEIISLIYWQLKFVIEKQIKTVGHLPKEISRVTKFILDRGVTVIVEVTEDHYRRSPLVQGGMEIPCRVTVTTPLSFNMAVLKKYEDMVAELYAEPKHEEILGTFITITDTGNNVEMNDDSSVHTTKEMPTKSKKGKKRIQQIKSRDIRHLFAQAEKRSKKSTEVVVLDSSDSDI